MQIFTRQYPRGTPRTTTIFAQVRTTARGCHHMCVRRRLTLMSTRLPASSMSRLPSGYAAQYIVFIAPWIWWTLMPPPRPGFAAPLGRRKDSPCHPPSRVFHTSPLVCHEGGPHRKSERPFCGSGKRKMAPGQPIAGSWRSTESPVQALLSVHHASPPNPLQASLLSYLSPVVILEGSRTMRA